MTYASTCLLSTIIREAGKAAGIWDCAPLLEEISPDTMKIFRETVRCAAIIRVMTVFIMLLELHEHVKTK